jgi:F-type H+-transporting ATPase subunit delta
MAELNVRYATALFDLSIENGALDESFEQAVVVRDILKSDECRKLMEHPHISASEKRSFLQDAFSGGLNKHINGFLSLLITKNREVIMAPALEEFINSVNRFRGRAEAIIVSASELNESQVTALKDLLSKKLNKHVDVELRVDPSLIGGFYIHADGFYMNRSLKAQLIEMKNSIRNGGGIA